MINKALQVILKDKGITQKGSNITPERLRFDFSFDRGIIWGEYPMIIILTIRKEGIE